MRLTTYRELWVDALAYEVRQYERFVLGPIKLRAAAWRGVKCREYGGETVDLIIFDGTNVDEVIEFVGERNYVRDRVRYMDNLSRGSLDDPVIKEIDSVRVRAKDSFEREHLFDMVPGFSIVRFPETSSHPGLHVFATHEIILHYKLIEEEKE